MLCKLCIAENLVRRYEPEKVKCCKKRFTKREAQKALNEIKQLNKPYRKETRMYQCPECAYSWHLSSKPEDSAFQPADIKYKGKWRELITSNYAQ